MNLFSSLRYMLRGLGSALSRRIGSGGGILFILENLLFALVNYMRYGHCWFEKKKMKIDEH